MLKLEAFLRITEGSGADYLTVSSIKEAIKLRKIKKLLPILLLKNIDLRCLASFRFLECAFLRSLEQL